MADSRTIPLSNLKEDPTIQVVKGTIFTPGGKGDGRFSELSKQLSVFEMEEIVNKLINHLKDDH